LDTAVTLLLAEDEPLVLLSTQDALEAGGYRVLPATSGAEALDILEREIERISGLITDVRLGEGPDGWELARRARELRPDLPVVYATADGATDWPVQGVPHSLLIQKPYSPAQPVTCISTLLTKAGARKAA